MRGSLSVPSRRTRDTAHRADPASLDARVVGAEAALAVRAVDERIRERRDVATRLPHTRMHEDRGVEPLDVVPRAHHRVPPTSFTFFLSSTPSGP
jgi:hypothetical protein